MIFMEKYNLLKFLQLATNCEYLSDLHREPYNTQAKLIFNYINLNKFSLKSIKETILYLYKEVI